MTIFIPGWVFGLVAGLIVGFMLGVIFAGPDDGEADVLLAYHRQQIELEQKKVKP